MEWFLDLKKVCFCIQGYLFRVVLVFHVELAARITTRQYSYRILKRETRSPIVKIVNKSLLPP